MPSTSEFGLPYPASTAPANVPADLQALADKLEQLLQGDLKLWTAGDIKFSVQDDDHGRWLKMSDRWLSGAEIESALSLDSGQADDLVALLGTGSASKYWVGAGSPGAAQTGKVYLPEARRKMPVGAGPSTDGPGALTARDLGAQGGGETVTLTAAQSGLPSHSHTATQAAHSHTVTDPGHSHVLTIGAAGGHSHGAGNLATASAGDHTHNLNGVGATAVSAGGHSHALVGTDGTAAVADSGTLGTSSDGSHSHGPGTLTTDNAGAHAHSTGSLATSGAGSHSHAVLMTTPIPAIPAGISGSSTTILYDGAPGTGLHDHSYAGAGNTDSAPNHTHNITGTTSTAGNHGHSVTGGSTASAGAHTHSIAGHTHDLAGNTASVADHSHSLSGATASSGAHTHTMSGSTASVADHTHTASAASTGTGISLGNSTPSITVNNVTAADAASSHNNMPPFVTLGYAFIRV